MRAGAAPAPQKGHRNGGWSHRIVCALARSGALVPGLLTLHPSDGLRNNSSSRRKRPMRASVNASFRNECNGSSARLGLQVVEPSSVTVCLNPLFHCSLPLFERCLPLSLCLSQFLSALFLLFSSSQPLSFLLLPPHAFDIAASRGNNNTRKTIQETPSSGSHLHHSRSQMRSEMSSE